MAFLPCRAPPLGRAPSLLGGVGVAWSPWAPPSPCLPAGARLPWRAPVGGLSPPLGAAFVCPLAPGVFGVSASPKLYSGTLLPLLAQGATDTPALSTKKRSIAITTFGW